MYMHSAHSKNNKKKSPRERKSIEKRTKKKVIS
jgi:hypothetical protein